MRERARSVAPLEGDTRTHLVLASASPRRRELLTAAGFVFEIDPPDVDETLEPGLSPERAALVLSERKARAVLARRAARGDADAIVLAADTIVAVGEGDACELLGKPLDDRDAARMLQALSSTRHRVITGVCTVHARHRVAHTGFERTWVRMRAITPAEVAAYVASGEWRDKAGGYAIQETADRFVVSLEEGGFDNVVGLPVELARDLLARAGVAAREVKS